MKMSSSPLKECKGKSVGIVYKHLFDETFDAHDSLEDVTALSRLLNSNKLKQKREDMIAVAREAKTFCGDLQRRAEAKGRKLTVQRLPISDGMKEKIGNAGLNMNKLTSLYDVGVQELYYQFWRYHACAQAKQIPKQSQG